MEMCNGMEEEPWVVVVEICSGMVVEEERDSSMGLGENVVVMVV